MFKDPKTTIVGVIAGLAGFVAFAPDHFGGNDALLVQICKYLVSSGIIALGAIAKDA